MNGWPTLLAIAEWLCGREDRDRVFEPLVADWQREMQEASASNAARRLMVHAAWSWGFCRTLGACTLTHMCVPSGASPMRAFLTTTAGALIVSSGVTSLYMLYAAARGPREVVSPVPIAVGFMAGVAMIMLPLAALPAAMLARGAGATRAQLARYGAGLVLAVVVVVGWVGPMGQRVHRLAFDETRVTSGLARGSSLEQMRAAVQRSRVGSRDMEMTLPELVCAWQTGMPVRWPERLPAEISRRAALVAMAIQMTILGWILAGRRTRGRVGAAAWFVATCAVMSGFWYLGIRLRVANLISLYMVAWVALAPALLFTWIAARLPLGGAPTAMENGS